MDDFSYERNEKSLAYIPYGSGKYYVRGGVNGGKSEAYLELIRTLDDWIQKDLANGIIAIWHDESYLNRYVLDKIEGKDYKVLCASYAFPQNFDPNLPFIPRILMRDKILFGGHNKLRGIEDKTYPNNSTKVILKKIRKKLKHFLATISPKI